MKKIYLAAGCFWGREAFFDQIAGIRLVTSGYANGKSDKTSYKEITETDHAEAVELVYDESLINFTTILEYYFKIIDPVSINRQGGDSGRQYRTGIYYTEEYQKLIAQAFVKEKQALYNKPIAVEIEAIKNFVVAEEYHQKYLERNPHGYCHIDLTLADEKIKCAEIDFVNSESKKTEPKYKRKTADELKAILTPIQYEVTQNDGTEKPFTNQYDLNFESGIYVDITTGEPLFTSTDKFNSGCGWPAFSKPISKEKIEYIEDNRFGMRRMEVRSKIGDAHLGHVFNDGPREFGGMRYCINSASLKFIPVEDMEKLGYGAYIKLVK